MTEPTAETPPTRTFTREEQIAVGALQKYNPEATKLNVWNTMPNVLGGTLVLIEFEYAKKNDQDEEEREEWCVLVRGNHPIVYTDWEDVLRNCADYKPPFLAQVSNPQFVVAFLTFGILVASIGAYFWTGDVKEPMRAGLASVIGFWLGRALPPKEDAKQQ
jgi:hypothetical protein